MKIPNFLQKGDSIGFIAPSYGCNMEPYKSAFQNAQRKLSEIGYHLDLGPNCYEGKGIGISNTPLECAKEVNEYFLKPENGAVFSCGGGELMCEILEHIDFEQIKKAEPKWFLGYSDNTNLTFLLATLCDVVSIYGPCAPAFGMEPWHDSLLDIIDILEGKKTCVTGYPFWEKESKKDEEHPLEPYHVTEKRIIKRFPDEDTTICGRLIGGCLDCLGNLVGTCFDRVKEFHARYEHDGFIWYLEACDLNVMGIRRTLWQLEHAGWFEHVRGFLIGRPLCHGEEAFGLDQYHAVTDVVSKYQVPILMDLDIGHIPPAMPIINGAFAEVNTVGNDICIQYDFTK